MQQVFGVSLFFAIGVLFNLVCITNKHIATNKIISTERFNKDVSSLVVDWRFNVFAFALFVDNHQLVIRQVDNLNVVVTIMVHDFLHFL